MRAGRDVVEGHRAREVELRESSRVPCGHEDARRIPGPAVRLQRLLAVVGGTGHTHPFVSADAHVARFYEHICGHDGTVPSTRQRPNRNL